jgi:hypothetical protein
MAIMVTCVTCALFFNQYVNPIALAAMRWKYYSIYIVLQALSIVCIYFFYPETKGLLLEEVATVFDGEKAVLSAQREGRDADDFKDGSDTYIESAKDYDNGRAA